MYPISIGKNCTTAFQIKRYMQKLDPKADVSRQFFDWLFMGGALGVAELFRNGMEFNRENFYAHETERGFIPRDSISGMAFLHDFETGYYRSKIECQDVISRGWETFSGKYDYLKNKIVRYVNNKEDIALIYYGNISNSESSLLDSSIKSMFQKELPTFNLLDSTEFENIVGFNIRTYLVNRKSQDPSIAQWKGDDISWDLALSEVASTMITWE